MDYSYLLLLPLIILNLILIKVAWSKSGKYASHDRDLAQVLLFIELAISAILCFIVFLGIHVGTKS